MNDRSLRGFSLVELAVAILLLGIAMVALVLIHALSGRGRWWGP